MTKSKKATKVLTPEEGLASSITKSSELLKAAEETKKEILRQQLKLKKEIAEAIAADRKADLHEKAITGGYFRALWEKSGTASEVEKKVLAIAATVKNESDRQNYISRFSGLIAEKKKAEAGAAPAAAAAATGVSFTPHKLPAEMQQKAAGAAAAAGAKA